MTRGCLIFAHNSTIDYGSQAVLAARLVNKHLGVPVSLVADKATITDVQAKFDQLPFDNIITVEKPSADNKRRLNGEVVDFINSNRNSAYNLTPYDRTLVIDSDFLVFSDTLNKYWNAREDFLICGGMVNFKESEHYNVSTYSIPQMWATNIMFSKTPEVKMLFDLVDHIKQEYTYYAALYDFDARQYRNDFAFSIACHIMSGHGVDPWHGLLPSPLLFKDDDFIVDVNKERLVFMVRDLNTRFLRKASGQDVHVMNKRDLIEHIDNLMELA